MNTVAPYSKLAFIYDRLMDHVCYKSWCRYLLGLINHTGRRVDSLVDLACGTGSMLRGLYSEVAFLIGCDQSRQMIDIARNKLHKKNVLLFLSSINEIAIEDNSVDSALLMYDSLNYITDDDSIERTFNEINRILKKGGIFIFDVVLEQHCLEHYSDYLESEYWEKDGYTRHSYYDPIKKIQSNEFRIILSGKTYIEVHLQKIYPVDYLKNVLRKSSFDIFGLYEDFTNDDSFNETGRIHFVNIKR